MGGAEPEFLKCQLHSVNFYLALMLVKKKKKNLLLTKFNFQTLEIHFQSTTIQGNALGPVWAEKVNKGLTLPLTSLQPAYKVHFQTKSRNSRRNRVQPIQRY